MEKLVLKMVLGKPEFSLIIRAYNEAKRIGTKSKDALVFSRMLPKNMRLSRLIFVVLSSLLRIGTVRGKFGKILTTGCVEKVSGLVYMRFQF